MRIGRIGVVGALVGVVLGGFVAAAGCEGADDSVSGGDEAEVQSAFRFHRGHRGHDAGSVTGVAGTTGGGVGGNGGSPGVTTADGGTAADCDICTKAQQCCGVVESRVCSFSAEACNSMVGAARPAYINACLTQVVSVRGAWGGNPPPECR